MGKWRLKESDRRAVKVYFSNPDLLWANEYPAPRFGQGAFATALRTLHKEVTEHINKHCCFSKDDC